MIPPARRVALRSQRNPNSTMSVPTTIFAGPSGIAPSARPKQERDQQQQH